MTHHKVVYQPLGLVENYQCFWTTGKETQRGLEVVVLNLLQNCYGAPSYYYLHCSHMGGPQTRLILDS